jgi:Fe-S cluster biogenesis protein NfuA
MDTAPDITAIEAALADLREGLNEDGYDMEVRGANGGVLDLEVLARENACEDCLVPQDTMAQIIQATLPEDMGFTRVQLTYPS